MAKYITNKFFFYYLLICFISTIAYSAETLTIPTGKNAKINKISGDLDGLTNDVDTIIWQAVAGDRVFFNFPLQNGEIFEKYGLCKFDIKIDGGPANVMIFIDEPGKKRYLYSPIDANGEYGEWQTVVLDLKQPEIERESTYKPEEPSLGFNLWAFDPGYPEISKNRKITIKNLRLTGRYLDVYWNGYEYDEKKDGDFFILEYPIKVYNRDTLTHEIISRLDTKNNIFSTGKIEPESAQIAPGDSFIFKVMLRMPSSKNNSVPNFRCEWYSPVFSFVDKKDSDETILRSSDKIFLPIINMPEIQNPVSLFSKEGLDEIISRYKNKAWAINKGNELIEQAEKAMNESLEIPKGPGWAQAYYYCHEHRCPLEYQGENKHYCPKGKEFREVDFMGVDLDRDYNAGEHYRYTEKAKNLALAFALTGDKRYSDAVIEILRQYEKLYFTFDWLDLDASTITIDKGRIQFAKYMEAPEFKNLIDAADILKGIGGIESDEFERLKNRLFLPAIAEMTDYRMDMYNRQALITQVALSAGLVFKNIPFLAFAIDSPYGYFNLRKWGASADGIGHEHGYSQSTVVTVSVEMAELLNRIGLNTFDAELKRIIDGTFWWSVPFKPESLSNTLTIAAQYYHDPKYYSYSGQSLIFGESTVSSDSKIKINIPPSVNFPNSGLTILRRPFESGTIDLEFKWGMPDNRGSFSVLSFAFNCYDHFFQSYPGQFPWGSTDLHHKWQIQTASHSTIVVDERNQSGMDDYHKGFYMPHPSAQIFYADDEMFAATMAYNDRIYPGVKIWRTAFVLDGAYLIADIIRSQSSHTYDWWFHGVPDKSGGTDAFDLKFHPFSGQLGKKDGYDMVTRLSSAETDKNFNADWFFNGEMGVPFNFSMKVINDSQIEIFNGYEWSRQYDKQEKEFVILRREKTKNADFVVFFEPRKTESQLLKPEKFVPLDSKDNPVENALGIRFKLGEYNYLIYLNPEKNEIKTSFGITHEVFKLIRD